MGDHEDMSDAEREAIDDAAKTQGLCPCGCGFPKGMANNPPGRNCKLMRGIMTEMMPSFRVERGGDEPGKADPIGFWRANWHIKTLGSLAVHQADSLLSMERADEGNEEA